MAIEAVDQLAMDEQVIEDAEAEEALEERHRRKVALAPVRRAYKEAHEAAKFAVERHAHEIADGGAMRIGRFRVTKRVVDAREVSFETAERTQLDFATLGESEDEEEPEQIATRFAPKKVAAEVDGDGRSTGYSGVH